MIHGKKGRVRERAGVYLRRGLLDKQVRQGMSEKSPQLYRGRYREMGADRQLLHCQESARYQLCSELQLGFIIPYTFNGGNREYIPDFILRLKDGDDNEVGSLVLEVKGFVDDEAKAKEAAAKRWVEAGNNAGKYGQWGYRIIYKTTDADKAIKESVGCLGDAAMQVSF